MQRHKQPRYPRRTGLLELFSGSADRELLPLYLGEIQRGNTRAARHLLELGRREFTKWFRPDDQLALYLARVLGRLIDLSDRRAQQFKGPAQLIQRSEGPQMIPPNLAADSDYYRALAKVLGLCEPRGRRVGFKENIDRATQIAARMADGETKEAALDEAEKNRQFGSKNAYARNRRAGRANVALMRENKRIDSPPRKR